MGFINGFIKHILKRTSTFGESDVKVEGDFNIDSVAELAG